MSFLLTNKPSCLRLLCLCQVMGTAGNPQSNNEDDDIEEYAYNAANNNGGRNGSGSGDCEDQFRHSVPVELAQHLLVAADQYRLERLKAICERNLCSGLTINNVATTLMLADMHSAPQLKKVAFYCYVSCVRASLGGDGGSPL